MFTVYPKKYAHGCVVLCFVVVMQSFIMNSHEVFIQIHQGCFAGTGAIVRLPQYQWSKPDGYGKISHISWDILYFVIYHKINLVMLTIQKFNRPRSIYIATCQIVHHHLATTCMPDSCNQQTPYMAGLILGLHRAEHTGCEITQLSSQNIWFGDSDCNSIQRCPILFFHLRLYRSNRYKRYEMLYRKCLLLFV